MWPNIFNFWTFWQTEKEENKATCRPAAGHGRRQKKAVLLVNVGPKTFGNLSDICQKSVRKLSVTKMCQKTVINVSEFCQKTVRCKYLSEIYQKRFGNASEMCQILSMCQKTVSTLFGKLFEICQKYHFWHIYDTFTIKMSVGQSKPTPLFCWNLSSKWELWP